MMMFRWRWKQAADADDDDGWLVGDGEGIATDGTIHASLDPQTCYGNK